MHPKPLILIALWMATVSAWAVNGHFTNDGFDVEPGGTIHLIIGYPQLYGEDNKEIHALTEKSFTDDTATLKYEGGASIDLAYSADGVLTIRFHLLLSQPDCKKLVLSTQIPFDFHDGGTWQVDRGEETPFPEKRPQMAHLYRGFGSTLTFQSPDGHGVLFKTPAQAWHEISDLREWNLKLYNWKTYFPIDKNEMQCQIHIESP